MIWNSYAILSLLALTAFTLNVPMNDEHRHEEINPEDSLPKRDLNTQVDGATHHVKSAGITYRQRIKNGQCLVEHGSQLFAENSIVKIRRKVFRVENCLLERVYHACGPNLLLMLSVVCRVTDREFASNTFAGFKRDAAPPLTTDPTAPATDKVKRVISESCCEDHCSISELSRYCHQ